MTTRIYVFAAACGLFAATGPAWAHHAFAAEFDVNKPLVLKGTVTEVDWITRTRRFTWM